MDFQSLKTEQANVRTPHISECNSLEIAALLNDEDATVALRVKDELPHIARLIDLGVNAMERDGRIFYVGAGTSGRLGVLDASEIPPTFHVPPDRFIGLIAGGPVALQTSKPMVEDDAVAGAELLKSYQLSEDDLVIGLTASGSSRFVHAAIQYARSAGAKTGCICCNKATELGYLVDAAVEVDTGSEAILGSTRLKAGTAQKMVLNMFSTGVMIRIGKVYKNYMVDFSTENIKLHQRAVHILEETSGVSAEVATELLHRTNGGIKEALVAAITGAELHEIREAMASHRGVLHQVLRDLTNK